MTNSAQTAGDKSREAPKPFDVQHLRGLLEAATKGPWKLLHDDPSATRAEASPLDDQGEGFKLRMSAKLNDCQCAQVWSAPADWPVAFCDTRQMGEGFSPAAQMANAALIVAAVSSLPALLDRVEELEARAQAAEARAEKMAEALGKIAARLDGPNLDPLSASDARDIARQALSTGETK